MHDDDQADDRPRYEDPYDRARRLGRESGAAGGDWRDNPHTPGTRAYYEYQDGQDEGRRDAG